MALCILRGPNEVPIARLRDRTVAVVGYGNQGRAHALNLRDSGLDVVVGQRDGPGAGLARADGFEPRPLPAAVDGADLVVVALPDEVQPSVFATSIAPHLRDGAVAGFLHGFSVRFGGLGAPPRCGLVLVAPKGPGATLRARYEAGLGLPALVAVRQDTPAGAAEAVALAWAAGIGSGRAGVIATTFAEEAETDLFGEQAVLCGGLSALVVAAFETLVDAGYPAELAYLECCHEVKQVADLVYERGLTGMMEAISTTAEHGAYAAGPLVVDEHVRARLREILAAVRDGSFAERFARDGAWRAEQRRRLAAHPIDAAGAAIRALMSPPPGSR